MTTAVWTELARRLRTPAAGGPPIWDALDARLDVVRSRPDLGDWTVLRRFDLPWGNSYAILGNRRDFVYFRLSPAEADAVELIDGTRTVGEIVVAHLQESGELDTGGIVELVRALHERNFLTDAYVDVDAAIASALDPQRGLRGGATRFLRTLTIEWSGAERMVVWWYRHGMRFLFEPIGLILALLVAFGGLAAFLRISTSGGFELTTQRAGIGFVVLLVLDMATVYVHELGHAAVLVHYRGRVKSAGFRIYFGTPAFFIESSDALLLSRRQRIAQAAAGPYVEAVFAGIAGIVLWIAPSGSVGQLLYWLCFVNYFSLLMNLVPFLELDGYWILADTIQVPDLRQRSLAFMRHDLWRKLRHRERWRRSEVGLGLYATVGAAFTVFVLYASVIFWQRSFGGVLASIWDAGLLGVLAVAVLALFIGGPLVRMLVKILRSIGRRLLGWWEAARFRSQRHWRIEAAELLDQQPGFEDLPVDVLNEIAGRVRLRTATVGETVIRQGDRADAYYVVRRGTLDVVMEDADTGVVRLRRRVRAGESFGEFGLVTGAPRSATVRCTSACELFVVDKSAFERLLADHMAVPEFAPTLQQLAELRGLPAFAHLSPAELEHLADAGEWVTAAPGETLIRQGDVGDAFYAIASGRVEIIRDGVKTRERGPGEHVGELALLLDQPRIATVRAVTPLRAYRLDRAAFDRMLRDGFRRGKLQPNRVATRAWEN